MTSQNQLSILCYAQRALLGNITPNLRAIYVVIKNDTSFKLVLYYDKPLSEDEEELASLIDTNIFSDFSPFVYDTDYIVKVIPYPNEIPKEGYCVYRRFEKDYK